MTGMVLSWHQSLKNRCLSLFKLTDASDVEQLFSNFFMLRHANTFWIWLRHTYFMKSKINISQTLRRELLIRLCQNIQLSRHTSASFAAQAHSLGNTDVEYSWEIILSYVAQRLLIIISFYMWLQAKWWCCKTLVLVWLFLVATIVSPV